MAQVILKNISKSFETRGGGERNHVIRPLDLTIQSGEFLVLLGPSGCGKSTLLRTIAGLETPDTGRIIIGDRDVTDLEPQDRNLAMVFQSYALYPHLTVAENMGFALKNKRESAKTIAKKVNAIAELLSLSSFLERKPRELSGGQRQRVALGRALVRETPVILFDEPLSNLDTHLRSQMRIEIKKIHQRLQSTIIYVTHDQIEATTMGDRIAILNRGRLEQIGTADDVYNKPATQFIAQFIGSPEINILEPKFSSELKLREGLTYGIRPEHLTLGNGPHNGTVLLTENLGSQSLIHIDSTIGLIRALQTTRGTERTGDSIRFSFNMDRMIGFNSTSGERVGGTYAVQT